MTYPFRKHQWLDQPAYVVGGGPSLREFDWECLKGVPNVVCVNMAYKDVPTAAAFFTEDVRVIEVAAHRQDWRDFKGWKIIHTLSKKHIDIANALDPNIILIRKQDGTKRWAKDFDEGLSYSSNSMIGALNFVDIMGCDPIYILGLDCNKVGKQTSNYHTLYPKDWKTSDHQYMSFASDFKHWAALHLRDKIVLNLNPNSAVECWPKVSWQDHFKAVRRG